MSDHPLDNTTWASLCGPHAGLAQQYGQALRYPPDIALLTALPHDADDAAWADLAALVGPGETAVVAGAPRTSPAGWEIVTRQAGVQLDGTTMAVRHDPEAVLLSAADVPEILDLVARTNPGPVQPHAQLLGTYLGVRRGGVLVAMAGERQRPPGWSEVSAVCTLPEFRGQGLAARLVQAVGAEIRERGEVPFLHTAAANGPALRIYRQLGFTLRRRTEYVVYRVPAGQPGR